MRSSKNRISFTEMSGKTARVSGWPLCEGRNPRLVCPRPAKRRVKRAVRAAVTERKWDWQAEYWADEFGAMWSDMTAR